MNSTTASTAVRSFVLTVSLRPLTADRVYGLRRSAMSVIQFLFETPLRTSAQSLCTRPTDKRGPFFRMDHPPPTMYIFSGCRHSFTVSDRLRSHAPAETEKRTTLFLCREVTRTIHGKKLAALPAVFFRALVYLCKTYHLTAFSGASSNINWYTINVRWYMLAVNWCSLSQLLYVNCQLVYVDCQLVYIDCHLVCWLSADIILADIWQYVDCHLAGDVQLIAGDTCGFSYRLFLWSKRCKMRTTAIKMYVWI